LRRKIREVVREKEQKPSPSPLFFKVRQEIGVYFGQKQGK